MPDLQGTVSYLRLNVLKYFFFNHCIPFSFSVWWYSHITISRQQENCFSLSSSLSSFCKTVKRCFLFPSWEPCPVTWLKVKLAERERELLLGSGWKSLLSGRHKCSYFFHKHFTRQGTLKRNDSKNYWKINEDPCSLVFYGSPAFLSSAVFTQQVNLLLKNMKSSSTGLLKGKRP